MLNPEDFGLSSDFGQINGAHSGVLSERPDNLFGKTAAA
jgi:hypothetical protein